MDCDAQTLVSVTPALNGIPIGLVPFATLSVLCQRLQSLDPMADCDPQSLIDAATCLECSIPAGLVPYAQLALLCQILQASAPSTDCDAATLVQNANCLACGVPPGLVPFASLYLLCQSV